MEKFILALDQGTTSSRAIVFNHKGQICYTAQKEFPQYYPQPAWVEHDAREIWSTQLSVASQAIMGAGLEPGQIAAIGITNQRETTVVWDRETGQPVCAAIVWQDRRTAAFCDLLKGQDFSGLIQEKTGLIIDAYFSATKLKWILDHVSGAREKAIQGSLAFGTVDCWLLWNLTGGKVHATDVSNASRTMIFNIHTLQWDEQLLGMMDIPVQVLPEVRSSSEIYGSTKTEFFGAEIPVAGIAGDQQAALFGQMCTHPGLVKNTYGTGCFMVMHTGAIPIVSHNHLLTTIAWKLDGVTSYALEGSIFIAGAVVQWLRDGLELFQVSSDVEALASSVENTGGLYLVPAFSGLGAPHWDSHARGMMTGITRGTTKAQLARAALESIAYQTRDVLISMESDCGMPIKELRVDGGASVNNLLMQFQADLLGVAVTRPKITETTALGAAFLAGLAIGFWKNLDEIGEYWQQERRFIPKMERGYAAGLIHGWDRAIKAAKAWSALENE
jgi:glycerol kinase